MIHYESERVTIHHGDCLDVLRSLPDCSVDAVVTDPPAGIAFMGRSWDSDKGGRDHWVAWLTDVMAEALRVAKPGAHALVWALPRTSGWTHRALEDAGWEVRDCVAHLFGSGFPKSLDVSKAIDKAAGAEREVVSETWRGDRAGTSAGIMGEAVPRIDRITAPATPDAARWQGWGTALKPGAEFWYLARKPLSGTVAATVLAWGTGALNVDGCRIESGDGGPASWATPRGGIWATDSDATAELVRDGRGRWPANVVLDSVAAAMLDEQSGERPGATSNSATGKSIWGSGGAGVVLQPGFGDSGGASRFFYTAKADSSERPRAGATAHPTVKPLDLMRWLVRLVTQPGGTVLEPFAGSGTTVEACLLEGFRCVAIEREADYLPLIEQRIARRVDPVAHHELTRADDAEPSLFDLFGGDAA